MRVVLLGMVGPYAGPALTALLAAGAEVVGVAVPAPPGAPPVAAAPRLAAPAGQIALGPRRAPTHLELAAARGVPTLALRRMAAPEVREALATLRPDLVVVACWSWRLPRELLAVPRLGALNLHPSPLPELRGPEPLFWAFQEGRARTAVTLHWMDEGLDTGEIALQRPLDLPAGLGWDEAEAMAAALGAELLGEAVPLLSAGALPRRPQGPGGSFRAAPRPADFAIDVAWPAERAFRFMRGTAAWGRSYTVALPGATLRLGTALSYEPAGTLAGPYEQTGGLARVRMAPGVLVATVAGPASPRP
ncbi:MAG TPA: formyltransferase family protein [Chloroflexaceae bacterium]|nr:formyltransferase family protein [Chloroflexaceae bacterium]